MSSLKTALHHLKQVDKVLTVMDTFMSFSFHGSFKKAIQVCFFVPEIGYDPRPATLSSQ